MIRYLGRILLGILAVPFLPFVALVVLIYQIGDFIFDFLVELYENR